jgi:hypothetical protein
MCILFIHQGYNLICYRCYIHYVWLWEFTEICIQIYGPVKHKCIPYSLTSLHALLLSKSMSKSVKQDNVNYKDDEFIFSCNFKQINSNSKSRSNIIKCLKVKGYVCYVVFIKFEVYFLSCSCLISLFIILTNIHIIFVIHMHVPRNKFCILRFYVKW